MALKVLSTLIELVKNDKDPIGYAVAAGIASFGLAWTAVEIWGSGGVVVLTGLVSFAAIVSLLVYSVRLHEVIARLRSKGNDCPAWRIFDRSDSADFRSYIEDRMLRASRIRMIGTGLAILFSDPFRARLMQRAATGECRLEIFLADPQSPDVQARLVEEELGEISPPVGQQGLERHLQTFLRTVQDLGVPDTITIRLFSNYPTFALLIVDDEYFMYPYGFARLGNFSPVLCFSQKEGAHAAAIEFFDEQYRRVRDSVVDAREVVRLRTRPPASSAGLRAFALFFVPPPNSPLYRFGSDIVGFSIREQMENRSAWQGDLAHAGQYGFHLTVCDALYFLSDAQLRGVRREVEFVARGFQPFYLAGLRVEGCYPSSTALSIQADDPTGCLEALHHELVHRVYRRATASNYTLAQADIGRDNLAQRTALMIKRYQAPYILGRFQPHFTLLDKVKSARMDETVTAVRSEFEVNVRDRSICVDRLALMTKKDSSPHWSIVEEIGLG